MDTQGPLYASIVWFAYTIVGFGISVIVGTMVGLGVSGSELSLADFTDRGQFAVYGASLLVGAYYVSHKPPYGWLPFTEWFGIVTIVGLVISTVVIILGTLVSEEFMFGENPVDPDIYRIPSIVLFGVALGLATIAVHLDHRRLSPDLRAETQSDVDEINQDLDKTIGGQP